MRMTLLALDLDWSYIFDSMPRCAALLSTAHTLLRDHQTASCTDSSTPGGQVRTWCAVFAAGGAVAFLSCLLQQSGFAAAGMELTRRLRLLVLSTLLRQARASAHACVSQCHSSCRHTGVAIVLRAVSRAEPYPNHTIK